MAAVLFKHVKANNHSFDSIYRIALPLPFFTDTDACIGGEGPFFCVEECSQSKGGQTFRTALGLDMEVLCGAESKLFFVFFDSFQVVYSTLWTFFGSSSQA